MELSALGNQHRSKLTVQMEITSKSVAVLVFESSSLTAELKLESNFGWLVRQMSLSLAPFTVM
jgi:plasmid maintenance system antidote protein VapI